MGIRVVCANGHKLHVKSSLAGKRGICPDCGAKVPIPRADIGSIGDPAPPLELAIPRAKGAYPEFKCDVVSVPPVIRTDVEKVSCEAGRIATVEAPAISVADEESVGVDPEGWSINPAYEKARRKRQRSFNLVAALSLLVACLLGVLAWVVLHGPPGAQKITNDGITARAESNIR